jgi:hypothetical protein
MAVGQNAHALVCEAERPEYVARLLKSEEAATKAALNALIKLDAELEKVQSCRAHRQWLASPLAASGTGVRPPFAPDVFCHATTVTRPNGEAPQAKDLTNAVREALEDPAVGHARRNNYGFPVGAIKPDEQMTGGAARAFQEQLGEAEEAQTVLAAA